MNGNFENFNTMLAFVNSAEKNANVFPHTLKIRFLRNFTIEPIEAFLKFHLYQAQINPTISYSDYGSIQQEILDPNAYIAKEKPDILVFSLFYHVNDLFSHPHLHSLDEAKKELCDFLMLLSEKTNALILINTFIPPFYSALSAGLVEIEGTPHHYSAINHFIRAYVTQHSKRFILMDWEKYSRQLGELESMDYRYWYMNKAPFKKAFLNRYAVDITRVAKVLKGKIKKCLVLDCDNTLWGGIIGEDEVSGIKLDTYEYPGKIFYDFQQTVLKFYKQGVLIALCSKNNEADVWQVLDHHPASLLKREHLSAYRINWQDKATNIKELASQLNLGLDSFVFVDDNPAECELIRTLLPEVTVFQVPQDLSLLPSLLLRENIFDVLGINEEDKNRTLSYQQENSRQDFKKQFTDIEDYLRSLNLKLHVFLAKENEFARVAQLTQKTNQFNLSVRRYSEEEIKAFAKVTDKKVFSLWVEDRFGNYGLTGVLIAFRHGEYITLNSLLLSCRILSRRIEYAFVKNCMQQLQNEWQLTCWRAEFLPTDRNAQVKAFLEDLGFRKMAEKEKIHIYALEKALKIPKIDFIQIISESDE